MKGLATLAANPADIVGKLALNIRNMESFLILETAIKAEITRIKDESTVLGDLQEQLFLGTDPQVLDFLKHILAETGILVNGVIDMELFGCLTLLYSIEFDAISLHKTLEAEEEIVPINPQKRHELITRIWQEDDATVEKIKNLIDDLCELARNDISKLQTEESESIR